MPLLATLLLLKPLATAACLGSGGPGGLFTPTITLGALLGGLAGCLWSYAWPGVSQGAFATVGACAFLAASTQGPVSAVILVLELTRRLDTLMVPAILATAGATLVARLLEHRSIYSGRIHVGHSAAGRAVGEKQGKGFIAISSGARLVELLGAALRAETEAQPLYAVDERGRLLGQIFTDRVKAPPPEAFPLETATAADFVTSVQSILTSDGDVARTAKFALSCANVLPLESESRELVGICHRLEQTH